MPTKSKFNPYDYNPNNSNETLNNAKFKRRLLRVHGEMNGWMDGWMDEWMDGRLDGWTNGWMDKWTERWMNGWKVSSCLSLILFK